MIIVRWVSRNADLVIAAVMTLVLVGLLMQTLEMITERLDDHGEVIQELCNEPVNEVHCARADR